MASRPFKICTGACHCGAVRFEAHADFPELTMCICPGCKRKNAVMIKVHASNFVCLRVKSL